MRCQQYDCLVFAIIVATRIGHTCTKRKALASKELVSVDADFAVSMQDRVDRAIQLWCDSSVNILILSRELRKAGEGDQDFHKTFAVLQQISVLIEKLNTCQVTDIRLSNGIELPSMTILAKSMLSRIIKQFRESEIQSYLDSVFEYRRLFLEKSIPIQEPRRDWIRHGERRTGMEIMSSNLREGLASKSWLVEWEQKLKLNVAEMMVCGLDDRMRRSSGQAANDVMMQSVFGNYMENRSRILEEERREEFQQHHCGIDMDCLSKHAKVTLERDIINPVRNFVKGLVGKGKHVPELDDGQASSMLEDWGVARVYDAKSIVGHALMPPRRGSAADRARWAESDRWYMNQRYGYRVTNLHEWCAAVIDTHGFSVAGVAAVVIWIVGVLIPMLILGAVLVGLGLAVAGLLLGIAVVTAPIWLSVLGVLKAQGRV